MRLSPEDHTRAIELSDAAGRALAVGNTELANKLTSAASALMGGNGQTFDEWATARNHNVEQYQGAYVSKHTQELCGCWLAAGGSK